MKYRPEIDGLRAVAVVPVILFHAGVEGFAGGFLGVDVFFVISGFLITSLILPEIQSRHFSFADFYERRARRILPALYLMMLLCVAWSLGYQAPFSARDFFQSVTATTLFAQNFLLTIEGGNYFDLDSELKPLLHTWSLAVEEQFYLLFPLLLVLLSRLGTTAILGGLIALGLTSSIYGYLNPALFYLPQTRAWELLVGALAAYIYTTQKPVSNSILTMTGCLLIGTAFFLNQWWTQTSLFQQQVIASLGVLLVLLFGGGSGLATGLLSSKPAVQIGLISYSAYLWHQPLLAFTRQRLGTDLSVTVICAAILATLILAYVSWRVVEQPFRNRQKIGRKRFLYCFVISTGLLLLVGLAGHFTYGFEQLRLAQFGKDRQAFFVSHFVEEPRRAALLNQHLHESSSKQSSTPHILVVGDSMADDFLLSAQMGLPSDTTVKKFALNGPCFDGLLTHQHACGVSLAEFERQAAATNWVILASDWAKEGSATAAVRLYQHLKAQGVNTKVVTALRFIHLSDLSYQFIVSGEPIDALEHYLYRHLDTRTHPQNQILYSAVAREDLIDKYQAFCQDDAQACQLYDPDHHAYFFDALHMSVEGLEFFTPTIKGHLINTESAPRQ